MQQIKKSNKKFDQMTSLRTWVNSTPKIFALMLWWKQFPETNCWHYNLTDLSTTAKTDWTNHTTNFMFSL